MRSPKLFARSLALVFSLLFALPIRAQVAGTLDAAFNPNVTGTVFATAVQADGKILIAGQITAVGGVAKTRITRLNVDGTADTFTNGTGPNSDVYAVAVQPDGKIVIGGLFATVNSQARGHIARLNADGTVEATGTFNSGTGTAGGTGGTGVVNSVAVQADGKILIAGDFTTLNGVTNNRIARLNADGTVDSAFTTAVGTGTNLTVRCVMVQADGKIVIAGDFTTLNGVARNRIARLNANGSPDAAFSTANGAGADAMVVGVVQQGDGKLVVVGNFTTLNALARVRYGRLNTDGSVDTVFLTGTGANVVVNSAALQTDGNILLAGNFTTVSTQARNFIARLSGADGSVEAVGTFNAGTGPNTFVNAVALQTDGKILLGGSFASVAGTGRVGVARLANDLATTTLGATSGTRMFWGRSGAAPEVQQVTFDTSTDGGVNWTSRGSATRVTGGWEVTGLTLAEPMALRARGRVAGGYNASSSSFTQQISAVDFTTQVPTLTAPATNAVTKSPITVSFTLPEAAQAGTLTVTFNDGTTARVMTLAAVQGTAGAHTFNFDPSNVVATSAGAVTSIAPNAAIAEGIHTVTLSYKDAIGNAAATAVSTNVKIDTVTQAPTLTAPATASTTTTPVTVSFSLPEAALAGSVTLTFTNGTARVLTLAASQETQGAHSFTFNPATPVASSGGAVASGVAILDGSNTVVLSYKDALGNAAATATSTTVKIDTTTLAPALTAPATNAITTTPVTVTFNLPEAALAGSVTVTFNDGTTPRVLTLAASQATLGAHTFTFNPSNPVGTSTGGAVTAGVAIPDGIYTVSISYQDALSNPAATTSTTNVKIDTTTLPPTLTAPVTGVTVKSPVTVSFNLPEAAQNGSLSLTFNDGTTARVLTLANAQGTVGAHTFSFGTASPATTSSGAVTAGVAIPDGVYTVTFSYKDVLANPAATASTTNVVIDTVTQPPTLTAPTTGLATRSPISVAFSLPETALAGSVTLTFNSGTTPRVLSLAATQESSGAHSFTFDPATPVASSGGAVAVGAAIPDDIYAVTISYQDAVGNLAATSGVTGVKIDTTTLTPVLTSPASGTSSPQLVDVAFSLPEAAAAGTVKLSFGTHVLTLATSQETAGAHAFTFFTGNPPLAAQIASGLPIPDGLYIVTLSYQDTFLNTAATIALPNVRIDTEAPTITGTFKPLRFPVGTKMPNYTLQAVVADASTVILTQSPLAGSTPAVGTVTITITGTDAAGNHSSISFDVEVRSAVPGSTALASQGAAAPGAGVAGGPPADALLASFGVPTTDAYENVAYLAKWTSVLSGKGSGLFRRDAAGVASSVAIVGGAVPDTTGVIFKTLADPVLDSGKVGFLATLKGFPITVPKARAAVVLSDAPSGALAVIARAGDPAPGVTGPVFKSFKSLAVTVDSIAVFAQISGGTGAAKVTAANDIGLWMQDSSHPLALVLREGQVIGTHTIKTLVSFLPGLGSPGQGRGWLTQPASGPQVLALALYVDKSQAVLSADITGTITTLSETGAGGIGAPGITNTRFASYSVPAVTDAGHSAFLGTLTVGFGGVTKLNQRAIFLKTSGSTYAPIVQLGDTSQQHGTANGATFSLLKDPVLASDDGLAFFATLKGGSALGLAASTIWWQPPGAPVKLLAQGTKTPPGFIPGTQWKAFTGLAIAPSRGPIFTATLKGGSVISGNATGAWGVDFTGATRLLFRSGDVIGGKTVKSFTMLNALVGTIGNTRSFNDSGQLLWLATFTDKTTAIIKTEIP